MAGLLKRVTDGLMNAVSGIGTTADPRSRSLYMHCPVTRDQIIAAYRGSGMMKKCIDIPALDMVRAWREWNADDVDIEKIEAEEKRLGLRQKIYEAEILRGLGGGAIVIGAPGDPSKPLPKVGIGGVAFLHVLSRWQITIGDVDLDPFSPNYGEPLNFRVNDGQQITIHPSRVVCFRGEPIPQVIETSWEDRFWGESRVERLLNAVKNADTAQDSVAALLHKLRVTRVGIPDLMTIAGDPEGEAQIMKRLAVMAVSESVHNATVYDKGNGTTNPGEQIDDVQVALAGMADLMGAFDLRLCAVADIPATRLLGKAAEGMNSSGDGQQQDWHKHVRAMQELRLGPCVDKLDAAIIPSATGKVADKSIWYEWAALDVPDEKAEAETFKVKVEAAVKVQETGAVPDAAFAEGFQSMLVESGMLPALETALEKIPETERYEMEVPEPVEGDDPSALTQSTGERSANDAAPRSLYVQRKLLNAADLVAWARAQGFSETLKPEDMHVTVLYSRNPVDWMEMGQSWQTEDNGNLRIAPGGARIVEPLGDKGAVVLLFNSSHLAWRHEEMVRAGASHDYDQYQPHVTITYSGAPADLASVEPYRGELLFGPEIFEELDEDWALKIEEA